MNDRSMTAEARAALAATEEIMRACLSAVPANSPEGKQIAAMMQAMGMTAAKEDDQ